jgi:hypothetical protein
MDQLGISGQARYICKITNFKRVAITVTFGIYVVAGRNIYLKRSRLRSFSQAPPKPPQLQNPFTSFKTTEINITTSELVDMSPTGGCDNPSGIESQDLSVSSPAYEQYSVRIERGGPHNRMPQATVPGAQSSAMRQHKAAMEANTAAWGYTKCAILFFASLLITWSVQLPLYFPATFFPL